MSKAGNNIYKRKDGRYEGRIRRDCRSKYIYVYARTLREVRKKMENARTRPPRVAYSPCPTVRSSALEWLRAGKNRWKPTTYDRYSQLASLYIIPVLGEYHIGEINRMVLEDFAEEVRLRSHKERLSDAYIKYICSLVCQVIHFAGEKYHLEIPAPCLRFLRSEKEEARMPEERDLERLTAYLTAHSGDDTCLGILLASQTGIRIGELCALQWKDIDLERGIVSIRKNLQRIRNAEQGPGGKTRISTQMPKTLRSQRQIPLPDELIRILKQNRKAPDCYLIAGKFREWTEVRTLQYRFASLLKRCGIRHFHFHLLRHAFASRCIRQGCDIKSLSEILGHSSVSVTMNIYVHSSLKQKKEMINLGCRMEKEETRYPSQGKDAAQEEGLRDRPYDRAEAGKRLLERRLQLGLDIEEAAQSVGISSVCYRRIEEGKGIISLETLIELSRRWGISMDFIIYGNKEKLPGELEGLTPEAKEACARILYLLMRGAPRVSLENCLSRPEMLKGT